MSRIKIGDTIEHEVYGQGVIEYINRNRYSKLPVKAHFKDRKTYAFFTKKGEEYKQGPMKMIHW